jgi:hypothetical protein
VDIHVHVYNRSSILANESHSILENTVVMKINSQHLLVLIPTAALALVPNVAQATPANLTTALNQYSIGNMSRLTEGIQETIPSQARDVMGGLTSINCPKGATPASCIPMAVWNTTFKTGDLTPASIAQKTGVAINLRSSLAQTTPWLSRLTVSEVLAANPAMASMPIVTATGARTTLGNLGTQRVGLFGSVVPSPQANQLLGNVVDLRQTSVAQFPQIQNIQLKQFPGLAKLPATVIPGLPGIKIPDMPGFSLPAGAALMKLDLVRTKERNIRHMVMSDGGRYKCDSNCDYGEFRPWVGLPYLNGAKIISGDSQQVPGGSGLLATINGGKEPAGVEFNLGSGGVKFVIRNVAGRGGSARVNINLRGCGWLVGCTPYFVGIPLFTISEKNNWFPLPATNVSIYRQVKIH